MAFTFAAYSTPKLILHLYAEGTVVGHPQDCTTMPEVIQNSDFIIVQTQCAIQDNIFGRTCHTVLKLAQCTSG